MEKAEKSKVRVMQENINAEGLELREIEKGIVIDHIQAGLGPRVFNELGLENIKAPKGLLMNLHSTKHKNGLKDMIKIVGDTRIDTTRLGLLDPNSTINIVEGGGVVRKKRPVLPEKVTGIIKCKNPRCITNQEDVKDAEFTLFDKEKKLYMCEYCSALNTF